MSVHNTGTNTKERQTLTMVLLTTPPGPEKQIRTLIEVCIIRRLPQTECQLSPTTKAEAAETEVHYCIEKSHQLLL